MTDRSIIAADFDRARQEMLQEFRRLAAVDRGAADDELEGTYAAMIQLLELEAQRAR